MTLLCLDAATLAGVIRRTAKHDAVEHAGTCPRCAHRLELVQAIIDGDDGDAVAAYRRVRRAEHARRNSAKKTVARLEEDSTVEGSVEVRTTAVIEEIRLRALSAVYTNPDRACALMRVALPLAERLHREGAAAPDVLARTYGDAAYIEKICISPESALRLVDAARHIAEQCADAEYERARVEMMYTLWLNDPDWTMDGDVPAITERCEEVFRRRRAIRPFLSTLTARARASLYSDPAAAAARFREVIAEAEAAREDEYVACGSAALALALVNLGEPAEAVPIVARSIDLYRRLGQPLVAAITGMTLASAYDALGKFDEALEAIDAVISSFAWGDDTYVRAELIRANILLHAGAAADAAALCSAVAGLSISLDAAQPNRNHSATAEALACLREAVARQI